MTPFFFFFVTKNFCYYSCDPGPFGGVFVVKPKRIQEDLGVCVVCVCVSVSVCVFMSERFKTNCRLTTNDTHTRRSVDTDVVHGDPQ